MSIAQHVLPTSVLVGQIAVVLLAPLALVLTPPASGEMLLVPMGQTNAVVFAREHGALLLAPGALPGSIVVTGQRERLLGNPAVTGMLVLAASPAGCGIAPARTEPRAS